jgi:hypothetical protein
MYGTGGEKESSFLKESRTIQKREAYFDCTVALDDSSATLARAEQPTFSSLAILAQPRLHEKAGDVVLHRNSASSRLNRIARRRSR